jgi:hypothetical protein
MDYELSVCRNFVLSSLLQLYEAVSSFTCAIALPVPPSTSVRVFAEGTGMDGRGLLDSPIRGSCSKREPEFFSCLQALAFEAFR